jgi:hypothetical protein
MRNVVFAGAAIQLRPSYCLLEEVSAKSFYLARCLSQPAVYIAESSNRGFDALTADEAVVVDELENA